MQVETLKIFCDLVDSQSFSQAAERNYVTQSAVSQQIRGLEEKFRHRLLERVRGRSEVRLTEAGATFYEESRRVLAAYDQLQERMSHWRGTVSGVVRVATVYSIGIHELPPVLREFMTEFPDARVDLEYGRTTRVMRDVLSGAVDLGVVAYPEKQRGISIVPLSGDQLVLIAPPTHPLAKRKKVKAADLNEQDFVLFERDIPTRRAFDRIIKSYGVTVRRVAEFDNIETIKSAVEVGLGLAVVPLPSVINEKKRGELVAIELVEPEWKRDVGVVYRSDRMLSTAARKFLELLKNHKP